MVVSSEVNFGTRPAGKTVTWMGEISFAQVPVEPITRTTIVSCETSVTLESTETFGKTVRIAEMWAVVSNTEVAVIVTVPAVRHVAFAVALTVATASFEDFM